MAQEFPSHKSWKTYQEVTALNNAMSNNADQAEGATSVFSKQDFLHMTVVNATGTQLRRSTVPRNQLFNALLSSVKPPPVSPPLPPESVPGLRSRIIEWTGVAEGPLHAGL